MYIVLNFIIIIIIIIVVVVVFVISNQQWFSETETSKSVTRQSFSIIKMPSSRL